MRLARSLTRESKPLARIEPNRCTEPSERVTRASVLAGPDAARYPLLVAERQGRCWPPS